MKTKTMNKLLSYPLIFHESNINIVTILISSKSVTCFYCIQSMNICCLKTKKHLGYALNAPWHSILHNSVHYNPGNSQPLFCLKYRHFFWCIIIIFLFQIQPLNKIINDSSTNYLGSKLIHLKLFLLPRRKMDLYCYLNRHHKQKHWEKLNFSFLVAVLIKYLGRIGEI